MHDLFSDHRAVVNRSLALRVTGRVVEVSGMTIRAEGLLLPVGSICRIHRRTGEAVAAQIVSVAADHAVLMPLHDTTGVSVGDSIESSGGLEFVPVGREMLGSVLDATGSAISGNANYTVESHYPVFRDAPKALHRRPIQEVLSVGVRSIDAMHTIGAGQRLGIFAGTGVGKSVLMGMIARSTRADVTVVALVGERGREVGDFIRKDLGEEGMKKCVLVVSTSDESPVLRVRAGFVATAVAEYFRDLGKDVLFIMDSTTRMAMAQRQIGLSAGEPPTTKGYPPSVFSLLPRLLERSGRTEKGTITGLYTVLVEGDDINEPVADSIRGILDGHVWLARSLANKGHYPAVSVLESISRVMPDVVSEDHLRAASAVRRVLATWADVEDLVNVGAYAPGANHDFDVAVETKSLVDAFLQQEMKESASFDETRQRLLAVAERIREVREKRAKRSVAAAVA